MLINSLVPMVIEQTDRGERAFDIFSRLLKDRIVYLWGGIDDALAAVICAQLLFLEAENSHEDVWLYINSPGGVVTSALAILDTMNYIRPDVATMCIGQAASAGSLLLCNGAKGKRHALMNSRIMIHQPLGGVRGQASDIAIHAQEILDLRHRLNTIYTQKTGKSLKDIEQAMERDKFLSPHEAIDFGLIDSVLLHRPQI